MKRFLLMLLISFFVSQLIVNPTHATSTTEELQKKINDLENKVENLKVGFESIFWTLKS
ncbi:hypothetical protein [Peribacillus muralis]|uniref:hypothetical protein n=1 Tax=Peribacillus muralis TaxID=264697 RepID=UPI003D051FEF